MRKTLFGIALAALVFSLILGANGASANPDRTQCWERVREAKVGLNSTAFADAFDRQVATDAITRAEVARSEHNYRTCIQLANFALDKMRSG
ncbi:MAG: hypothetical protein HYZ11_09990 [Candidatus Tectomicrobia bacterium]|uniref:DUF4398 domain-containing protein n=1 Tax=Tectimicrobiota bacterium TaxID=2528274 RepID=A0A932I0M3_UNCTE|nr:hypothetical protein [Candidatus Tectomicrobia bacterium]